MTGQHLTTEDLTAWLDGECTEEELLQVTNHLDGCVSCQAELDSLAMIRNAWRGLGEVDVPRSFAITPEMIPATPLVSPDQVTPIKRAPQPWEKLARFVAIAAAVAFIALSGAQLSGLIGDTDSRQSSPAAVTSETNSDASALQQQESAPALARGEVREAGESAAVGATALQAELARVDTPVQAENTGLTPLEFTTIGIGILALAAIAGWILIHYRAGTVS